MKQHLLAAFILLLSIALKAQESAVRSDAKKNELTFSAYPHISGAFVSPISDVTVSWRISGTQKQVKGYVLERTQISENFFTPLHTGLLSARTLQYTQKKVRRGSYYRITAVGFYDSHRLISFPYYVHIPDDLPPSAPTGLEGSIDSVGVVRLRWKPNPADNYVAGYRVLAANSPNGLFVDQCIQTLNPFFTDTLPLNTLSPAIYYKVVAIDSSYNYSPHSALLKLVKPDTIPPTAPHITNVQQQPKGMLLYFTPSYSLDVASYQLYYSFNETDSLRLIHIWNTSVLPASAYTFIPSPDSISRIYLWLFAVDHANNRSRSQAYVVQTGKNKSCTIDFTYKIKSNEIRLSWQALPCHAKHYRLYKAANDAPATLLRTLSADTLEYVDENISFGTPYRYILEVVSSEIKKAEEVKVNW
jgi:hypothetical protein